MELVWEISGWAGAAMILTAFLSVSMGWVKAGRAFQGANLLGAAAFILNGAFHEAWPSVATNAAWLLISAVSLLRMRTARGTEAGAEATAIHLPGVPDTTGQLAVVDPARGACTAPAGHAAQPGAVAA